MRFNRQAFGPRLVDGSRDTGRIGHGFVFDRGDFFSHFILLDKPNRWQVFGWFRRNKGDKGAGGFALYLGFAVWSVFGKIPGDRDV